jgi:acetyl/propionyl-CoA carboxylase alpha subunit
MATRLELAGVVHEVARIEGGDGAGAGLRIDGMPVRASFRPLGDGEALVTVDGTTHRVRLTSHGGRVWVHAGGSAWAVRPVEALDAAGAGAGSGDALLASMPGTVVSVAVRAGDAVAAGDTIMVIESMKLETTIAASRDGVVAEVGFAVGATFDKGAVLARLAAPDGAPEPAREA